MGPGRRGIAAGVTVALLAAGCAGSVERARGTAEVLRLGVSPTLTHAPAHVGLGTGIFARALAPTRVELHVFGSGAEAGVALLAGSIDASYMGPWPTASLYLRSHRVAVVSGATVGGTSLVVRRDAGIRSPDDLHGARIAVASIGNSQEVALRTWLHRNGLRATDEGGDVAITEIAGPQLQALLRTDRLDGAWVQEPYPTWLVDRGVADVLVDEADLWPPGRFLTASLVVSTTYLSAHPDVVERLVRANVEAIRFLQTDPQGALRISERRLVQGGAPPMSLDVIAAAWRELTFTWRPVPEALTRVSEDAYAAGMIGVRPGALLGILRLGPLERVLEDEGLPPVGALAGRAGSA
ncbi:MAG: ABC transporter substrate-binding protein [Candidatus Velamenicoccus archaeovorus]